MLAYASSQHHKTVEEFVQEVKQCKADGFRAYKIHPPSMPDGGSDVRLDMEVCKAVRQAVGDRPYLKDRIRIAKDGYVDAPVKPGLGYEIDRAVLERMTKSIER